MLKDLIYSILLTSIKRILNFKHSDNNDKLGDKTLLENDHSISQKKIF